MTAPDGTVIPGATVTIVNDATNQRLTITTDLTGSYGFSLLAPGTYRVEFSARGFKTSVMATLAVNVSEVPVVEAKLEIGAPSERVLCQCRVAQTATSAVGTLINSKTLTAMPLTTRNTTQVMSMSSGTAADVNNAGLLGRGTPTINMNGNTTPNTYTVDGTPTPPIDSESGRDFRIQDPDFTVRRSLWRPRSRYKSDHEVRNG